MHALPDQFEWRDRTAEAFEIVPLLDREESEHAATLAIHFESALQNARSGRRQLESVQLLFAGKGDVGHVAGWRWFSADAFAKIIDDNVVIFWPGYGAATAKRGLDEDAVEHFDQVEHTHLQPSLFQQFAGNTRLQRFSQFQGAAGYGPLAAQRLAATTNQQRPRRFYHYTTDSHHRTLWVFSGHWDTIISFDRLSYTGCGRTVRHPLLFAARRCKSRWRPGRRCRTC